MGVFLGAASTSEAMQFEIRPGCVLAEGEIEPGDADRLANLAASLQRDEVGSRNALLSLKSLGGDLEKGLQLGAAIRSASLPTLVESGRTCAGACALAFLGGRSEGVTADAISRTLEPSARLVFQLQTPSRQNDRLDQLSVDRAQELNAAVLAYAMRMGGVDLGLLSRFLAASVDDANPIDTPREIEAFAITLAGEPRKLPNGWAREACRRSVAEMLPPLDPRGLNARVGDDPEAMPHLRAFRTRFLDDKFPDGAQTRSVRTLIGQLSPNSAIDLLVGEPLYANAQKVAVWRVELQRGSGFYQDACYAVTDFTSIRTVIVDSVSYGSRTRAYTIFAGYAPDAPLW